jgi:PAS domain S-box-containing protein
MENTFNNVLERNVETPTSKNGNGNHRTIAFKLADLIDVPKLQELMDAFYTVTATPSAILDADGTVLTATAWQEICTQYHRANPECEQRCKTSDAYIAHHLESGAKYALYECANGLVDVASPIVVNGIHVGTVFTGQFLLEPPDTEAFRRQAQQFGFDETGYLSALKKVPVVQREKIEPILNYLVLFTAMLADMGLQRMQQLEAQRRMKESEERLRMAQFSLDNISDGVQWLNYDGRHIYVNHTMCHNTGYSHDELLSMTLDQIDPNVNLEQWQHEIWPLIKERGAITFDAHHRRKDGSIFPVEVTGNYLSFQGKEYLCAFARDITERKQQEKELHRQVELFNNLINTLPFPIFYKNRDGVYLGCNQLFASMVLNTSVDSIVGKTVYDLVPDDKAAFYHQADSELMRQGDTQIYEHTMHLGDGQPHVIMFHKSVFHHADGTPGGLIGAMIDITEQKQIEAERTALQQQVIDAQRDALRELSTPLIPITDKVVIMPLVGTIDSQRAQMIMEALLDGVASYRADLAILDITGVQMVDTQVAQALIQAAQAAKLLGAQVMLTGIKPQIAQTLVHLGVDLGGIITRGSLQSGIAAALQHGCA